MTTKSLLVATLGTAVLAGTLSMSALAASIVSFNGPAGEAYIGKFIKGINLAFKYIKCYNARHETYRCTQTEL